MLSSDFKGKKVKRKQAVLQTRKSLGGKKGSDDDDFKPIKPTKAPAAPKRKPPAPKSAKPIKDEYLSEPEEKTGTKETGATSIANSEESKPKRKAAVGKKPIKEDSEPDGLFLDDLTYERSSKAKQVDAKPKRKAAAIKKLVVDSDSEDDLFMDNSLPTKKAPNRRVVSKSKATSEDDMDVDESKAKTQSKGKEKEGTKRKRLISNFFTDVVQN
jgi:DNA topoisomerase II